MVDLSIITKVENQGQVTSDINVLLQIENGVFTVVCGWVIWDMPNGGWAWIPILVQDVDQLLGAGSYYVSARVYENITPGTKIQDLIQDGNIL